MAPLFIPPRAPLMRMPEGPRPLASLLPLERSESPVATMVTAERMTNCFVCMPGSYEPYQSVRTGKGNAPVTWHRYSLFHWEGR